MAKEKRELIEVRCPCCDATLQIDAQLKAVISHQERKRPAPIEDMAEAVQKLKGEEARRGEAFQKSFEQHKSHQQVLEFKAGLCASQYQIRSTQANRWLNIGINKDLNHYVDGKSGRVLKPGYCAG